MQIHIYQLFIQVGAYYLAATVIPLNFPVLTDSAIRFCLSAGPVICALVPPESTATVTGMSTRSLGGRRNVGCKLTAAVYFSPMSCQISRYSAAKSSKTIPSLGPIFAQTPSAAQAPGELPIFRIAICMTPLQECELYQQEDFVPLSFCSTSSAKIKVTLRKQSDFKTLAFPEPRRFSAYPQNQCIF